MAAMGQTLSPFHRQNKIQIAASQIQNTTSQIQITDMKRGGVTRLLWVGLLVYCIAQTATFVLLVTHLAKVVKTSIIWFLFPEIENITKFLSLLGNIPCHKLISALPRIKVAKTNEGSRYKFLFHKSQITQNINQPHKLHKIYINLLIISKIKFCITKKSGFIFNLQVPRKDIGQITFHRINENYFLRLFLAIKRQIQHPTYFPPIKREHCFINN